jgi:SNF2 family DNA or RNA helicase
VQLNERRAACKLGILFWIIPFSDIECGDFSNNILMQLRKCLQHPYLIDEDLEPHEATAKEKHETLVDASTKLHMLQMLLPRLKKRGHRALIFSQFVINLDILERYDPLRTGYASCATNSTTTRRFLEGEGVK